MKKPAHQLQPGDVVSSGETIVQAYRNNYLVPTRQAKLVVILAKPDGTQRTALWGYNSTIFLKRDSRKA